MKHALRIAAVAVILSQALTGCGLFLLGGGAAVAGLSIADRRPTLVQAKDQALELRINAAILNQLAGTYGNRISPPREISVVSYDQKVLLMGVVPTAQDRMRAGELASRIEGVREVFNHIGTAQGGGALNFANDSIITSRVRTALISPVGFSANHVKVVTYGGVTYALGMLTPDEQRAASRQISTIAGVRKLVTLFETYQPPSTGVIDPAYRP